MKKGYISAHKSRGWYSVIVMRNIVDVGMCFKKCQSFCRVKILLKLLLLLLLETGAGALYLIPLPKHRLSDTEYRKEEEMSMISNQHPLKPSETRQGSNLKFGLSEH